MEGSVRQELDQLRITIQLVGVDHQTPLWAESYNRTLRAHAGGAARRPPRPALRVRSSDAMKGFLSCG